MPQSPPNSSNSFYDYIIVPEIVNCSEISIPYDTNYPSNTKTSLIIHTLKGKFYFLRNLTEIAGIKMWCFYSVGNDDSEISISSRTILGIILSNGIFISRLRVLLVTRVEKYSTSYINTIRIRDFDFLVSIKISSSIQFFHYSSE